MARLVDQFMRYGSSWRLQSDMSIQVDKTKSDLLVEALGDDLVENNLRKDEYGNIHVTGKSVAELWRRSVAFSIRTGQVFAIDNVFRYLMDTASHGTTPSPDELPVCVPPFPELWVEYLVPKYRQHQYGTMFGEDVDGIAVQWSTLDLYHDYQVEPGNKRALSDAAWLNWEKRGDYQAKDLAHLLDTTYGPIRWQAKATVYARFPHKDKLLGPFAIMSAFFDDAGYLVQNPLGHSDRMGLVVENMDKNPNTDWATTNFQLYVLVAPSLVSFGFAHCKNVEMDDMAPPEKLQRATTRRGHPPLVTYKVLVIDPKRRKGAGKVTHTEGSEGAKNALHIVRGHFSWYGPGHPDGRERGLLWGKHAGQFWIPSHARGSASVGTVEKAYSVRSGGE